MYYKGTNRICNLEAQDEKTSKYNNKNQEKRMDLIQKDLFIFCYYQRYGINTTLFLVHSI
jgi:hypothetical protein